MKVWVNVRVDVVVDVKEEYFKGLREAEEKVMRELNILFSRNKMFSNADVEIDIEGSESLSE